MPRGFTQAYSQLILSESGLLGYWKMGETSGNIADSSPNATTGIANGAGITYSQAQIVTGAPETLTSIKVNSSNSYFTLGDLALFQSLTTFTLEGWVNIGDTGNTDFIVGRGNPGDTTRRGSWYLATVSSGGKCQARFETHINGTQQTLFSVVALTAGNHYLVGTWDGTTKRLYVDGTLANSQAVSGVVTNNAYAVTIGSVLNNAGSPSGSNLLGIKAHPAIYNVALSALQVAQHYQSGLGAARTVAGVRTAAGNRLAVRDFGSCLAFDGASSWVKVPSASNINPGTNSFTVGAWVNTQMTGQGGIISKETSASNNRWYISVAGSGGANPGSLAFKLRDNAGNDVETTFSASKTFNDGNWHQVVVVFDRTNNLAIGYIDGVAIDAGVSIASITQTVSSAIDLSIGSRNAGANGFLQGRADSARYYSKALSAAEVAALYLQGREPTTGLVSAWDFSENTGTTTADTGGGNNTGTLSGSTIPAWTTNSPMKVRTVVT